MPETAAHGTIHEHTAGDGYRWRYRHYPSAEAARGQVVCIHGIQSHGGWYTTSCERLAQVGFDVYFLDRRGAGLNEQDRGDAPGFRRLIDDLADFLDTLRRPGQEKRPVFVLAISWGGKVATALARRHPGRMDGLVLLCPGFCPKVRPSLGTRLGIVWSRLTAPRKLFPVPLSDPALFTANERWQRFIQNDPLSVRQATARFLFDSVRLDGYLRFVPGHVNIPVLLLLAEKDRIIDNARTRTFVARFASRDKTVIEYPGAHHTLEFEPDPEGFVGDIKSWLEKQASSSVAEARA